MPRPSPDPRPFLSPDERRFAAAVSHLLFANPFLPEWIDVEREALGPDFSRTESVWSLRPEVAGLQPNIILLIERIEALVHRLRESLNDGAKPPSADLALFEDLVLFLLYHRYQHAFFQIVERSLESGACEERFDFYREYLRDFDALLRPDPVPLPGRHDPVHVFACMFQVRRAFFMTFRRIVGGSMPAARLRAAIWQSIFTRDERRYQRLLFDRMGDITCLITGPSGTGKELVARAIGLSRYIPFDPKSRTFAEDFVRSFYPLNLSALSPTLLESEMFGHRRGAFTGALEDRTGWFEVCPHRGTVFLDEIGEVDPAIQVKLLRVLETRTFNRIGETTLRNFRGKLIAATNRDLEREMRVGRFREDFYYRLCSDTIRTPTLREQLLDSPGDLPVLVRFIVRRVAGEEEADSLTSEVCAWIGSHLDPHYAWPGNVRELEQCVRNVLIRGAYQPRRPVPADAVAELTAGAADGRFTAEELLRRYTTLVYARTGNYQETARRLGVDHRTVKARIDDALLLRYARASDRLSDTPDPA
jgi:transcriptional regulator with AAA-type ATPase domain